MENKYTVKELVEVISELPALENSVVCDLLSGCVSSYTKSLAEDCDGDLFKAIANWNTDFQAHKDDAILTLLDELLEAAICQQQPGKDQDTVKSAGP